MAYAKWPAYDESKLSVKKVEIAVQVNGKVRGKFEADADTEKAVLEETAKKLDTVVKHLEGLNIVKVIVIPNKIVNIVAK
jgi:leucyl-tRNA synthetase